MVEAGRAEQKLAELMGRLGAYFTRVEPLRQAGKYVRGLMSDLPRKNCWTLAEYAGDRTPDRMQRLLERASWNTFEAMDTVRDFVVEHLADPEGLTVLVLDESGDEKTGTHTAGVKRQYVGCAGKVANAVNFVNATYSTPRGQPVVLVAHSNAGLFVPVVVHAARRPVAGCVFVDASLPCRTGPTPAATPERLNLLRAMATEGRLPQWTAWWDEDDVALLFPDRRTRLSVSAEQSRLPLSYYEQQIPVPDGWDNRPCGYLLFGPPYDHTAQEARERGWVVEQVPGRHLHQLVDPDTVTARIVAMTSRWASPATD